MRALGEGQMPVRLARQVEPVGIGELARVTVGSADTQMDAGARGDGLAVEFAWLDRDAVAELDRKSVV